MHVDALQRHPVDPVSQVFEALKIGPHHFGVRIPRRKRHEPLYGHGRKGIDVRDGRRQRVEGKPAFGFFSSDVHFEQDGLGRVLFPGPALNLFGLFHGFNGMNEAESSHQPLELSSLEPADKVPLHAHTLIHRLHLGLCFLPPVFSTDGQTRPDGFEDPGRFDVFGRRDQSHALRITPHAFGSATDSITCRPDVCR